MEGPRRRKPAKSLRQALTTANGGQNLSESIRRRFEPLGGVELPNLPPQPIRKPPKQ
jgi:hypothetical protein